ncbi:MAG: TIGR00725 family protein [Spirochaetes bacterium]|nr:TIGR00725 family protein [Spirochaetota bacterium]
MRKKQVVVIGSSDDTRFLDEARAIGAFVAEREYVLITGGRGGIMEAASQGAAERGGIVIGILPGEDKNGANSHCGIVIPTGLGYARNAVNVLAADVAVAIGGSFGTLSEIAYSRTYGIPLICCSFAEGWSRDFANWFELNRIGGPVFIARDTDQTCRLIDQCLLETPHA